MFETDYGTTVISVADLFRNVHERHAEIVHAERIAAEGGTPRPHGNYSRFRTRNAAEPGAAIDNGVSTTDSGAGQGAGSEHSSPVFESLGLGPIDGEAPYMPGDSEPPVATSPNGFDLDGALDQGLQGDHTSASAATNGAQAPGASDASGTAPVLEAAALAPAALVATGAPAGGRSASAEASAPASAARDRQRGAERDRFMSEDSARPGQVPTSGASMEVLLHALPAADSGLQSAADDTDQPADQRDTNGSDARLPSRDTGPPGLPRIVSTGNLPPGLGPKHDAPASEGASKRRATAASTAEAATDERERPDGFGSFEELISHGVQHGVEHWASCAGMHAVLLPSIHSSGHLRYVKAVKACLSCMRTTCRCWMLTALLGVQ